MQELNIWVLNIERLVNQVVEFTEIKKVQDNLE